MSQAVTYTGDVVASWKQSNIETLLQTTNTAYPIAAIPMTLNDLQGHSPIASLFKWDFSGSFAADDKT